MNTKISILYNRVNDDLFAVIITKDGAIYSYSRIGQHSRVSESYIRDSEGSEISEGSIHLWDEVKLIYDDQKPYLITNEELLNIIDNENVIFEI